MKTHVRLLIIVVLVFSLCQTQIAYSQDSESGTPAVANSPSQAEAMPFPYFAEVTGDNLYVRSGSGTNFYECGKLSKGDRVKVVGKVYSWSRIVPPEGCFSWIYNEFVRVDPSDSSVGIVTGDSVRVYAGSAFVKPSFSTTLQGKLNKGDRVKLLGEQMDDYYKIAPPSFAFLYVSTNYVKPVERVSPMPAPVEEMPVVEQEQSEQTTAEPNEAEPVVVEEKPEEDTSPEGMLKKFNSLQKRIEEEQAKPLNEQKYEEIKKGLLEIIENKQAGKAARYAEFVIKRVENYELALSVNKEVKQQSMLLEETKQEIDETRSVMLADIQDLSKFAVIGTFKNFATYGHGHYRIVDESGKTVCYAIPAGSAAQRDLSSLVGSEVGLVGTIEQRPQTPPGAMVQFTDIQKLQ